MGKLDAGERVVSVCRNLNLFEHKAIENLSIADSYRFTRKYPLLGGVRH